MSEKRRWSAHVLSEYIFVEWNQQVEGDKKWIVRGPGQWRSACLTVWGKE